MYGGEFLSWLPRLYDGENDYGSSVFYRYKHRLDSNEEKIGIKVGENKNLLVKEYQEAMQKKLFVISNEDNIREITTFVKHQTPSGNIKYAADIGNDDTVMTIVTASTLFKRYDFKELAAEAAQMCISPEKLNHWTNIILNNESEYYKTHLDYSSFSQIKKQSQRVYRNR
jgi:hypothetical protein